MPASASGAKRCVATCSERLRHARVTAMRSMLDHKYCYPQKRCSTADYVLPNRQSCELWMSILNATLLISLFLRRPISLLTESAPKAVFLSPRRDMAAISRNNMARRGPVVDADGDAPLSHLVQLEAGYSP